MSVIEGFGRTANPEPERLRPGSKSATAFHEGTGCRRSNTDSGAQRSFSDPWWCVDTQFEPDHERECSSSAATLMVEMRHHRRVSMSRLLRRIMHHLEESS